MESVAEHEDAAPPRTVIDLAVVDHSVCLTLMCHFVRFYVEARAHDLAEDSANTGSSLREDFIALCDDSEDRQEDLEDWLIEPCLPFISRLAPMPARDQVFTLEDYYQPPTYCYRLYNSAGSITAMQIDCQDASLPRLPNQVELRVTTPEFRQVSRFSAAEFEIVRTFESDGLEFCDVPREVQQSKGGLRLAFKAASDDESLVRELRVYTALQTVPRGRGSICIPRFHGLVILRDGALGLILEYVDHQGTLLTRSDTASRQEKAKWFRQINETVTKLHQLGLVWGDVKPDNVLIRTDGNACVLDFGGGFHPEWIDQEYCNSRAGDMQALGRMKAQLDC